MVINLWGLDKYESKHTGSQTNVQANIRQMYEIKIMDRQTGKI